MQTLTLWMQTSLDGYTAGPDGEFDWPQVGPDLMNHFVTELATASTFVYGHRVYDMMASFWPAADEIPGMNDTTIAYSRLWKPMPKIVFSRSLERADWNTTVSKDPVATIKDLKNHDGTGIVFFGGADAARTLIEYDLIDHYRLNIHPIILGAGQRLFPTVDHRHPLEHISTRVFDGTTIHTHHRRREQ